MLKPFVQDADLAIHVGEALAVLRELPKDAVDAVVTSPPYLDARPEYPSPSLAHHELIFRELARVVREGGPLLYNLGRLFRDRCEVRWQEDILRAAERAGWSHLDTRIWTKPNANPIHGNVFADAHEYVYVLGEPGALLNVDEIRRPHAPSTVARFRRGWTSHKAVKNSAETKLRKTTRAEPNPLGARPRSYVEAFTGGAKGNPFPAPMPLRVAEWMVTLASWPGETVLDPFAGSGTTAVAARRLGRRCVAVELSPEYAALAAARLAQQSLLAEDAA